ncbi:beta-sarcoglycan [Diabrotica virgifera virgifera]|uniref:Beta-sarcoglycan n=1 Tax=Diabrotica virgifera virgifera TaxID=50390 RepID=A0A6P7G061_DIAVI|nr:beta-sarcoglycan [Diabrotica virgifera virgifera]
MDYRSTSPQSSEPFSDEMDTASVKEKAILNRSVPKFNNNFKAGYMPVENIKPGMRGRKTFAFWTLLVLLFILVIGNLILTVTIIGVLKLGHGMQSIELVPEAQTIKFFGETNLDHIYKRDGKVESFEDEPMEITSYSSPILLNLVKNGRGTLKAKIDPNETYFRGLNFFDINNTHKESIFTVNEPVYENLRRVNNFRSKHIRTNKISSPIDESLTVDGESITVKGAEGTNINGKTITWSADQDIHLKSINGSIVLLGKEGVFVDLNKIPVARLNNNYITSQFKICVCMPLGKIFRIPVANPNERVHCDHVSMEPQYNPCI